MKATEIIKLSLAGKTPAEIRELMELENELKAAEAEQAEAAKDKEKPEDPQLEQTPEPAPEKPEENNEPEPDYKKLYEESQAELKKAQAANSKNDMSGGEDPAEARQKKIEDLVRSFM